MLSAVWYCSHTFATGVVYTGRKFAASVNTSGNLPPVSLTLVANMPPVSTTLANLVAKLATDVIYTGGKFAAGVIDTSGASWLANISANFRKKFVKVIMGYSGAGGKLIHEKNQRQKISWHNPFKYRQTNLSSSTQWALLPITYTEAEFLDVLGTKVLRVFHEFHFSAKSHIHATSLTPPSPHHHHTSPAFII
jgi:hypothetical protein